MADSTSDSGSVQSLQADQVSEKKSDNESRFYALYSFYPSRPHATEEAEETSDQEDGSLSLNIVATNLAATRETDLRKALANRLTKSSRQLGEGSFLSVGLNSGQDQSTSATCYYCVVETSSDSLGFDHVNVDDKSDEAKSNNQQFVVCFVSFQDSSLDLFRSELDQYTQGLIPLLDKEPTSSSTSSSNFDSTNNASPASSMPADQGKLSQLSTGIQSYLEKWPPAVLGYLTRTLQSMGSAIQQLIHAALLNASLEISGASPEQEEDVKRFFKCCSLSTLMERLQPDDTSITGSSDSNEIWQLQTIIVSITFQPGQGVTFDKTYSCLFCKNAADKLMTYDPTNVTKIRDFLESIKLAFIHNLNKLKRFLKLAEVDHYALYRALCYLKKCGCGDLLLRYVKLDGGQEIMSVLNALETFIKDMRQTLV